jgi:hypothetical protein
MARSQIVKRLTDDGVVVHLELTTVFEDQSRGRLRRIGSRIAAGLVCRRISCVSRPWV